MEYKRKCIVLITHGEVNKKPFQKCTKAQFLEHVISFAIDESFCRAGIIMKSNSVQFLDHLVSNVTVLIPEKR